MKTDQLWMFAYDNRNSAHIPKPILNADKTISLPIDIWEKKYEIITRICGFCKDSWEARTTPVRDAFWAFSSVCKIKEWLDEKG